MYLVNIVLNQEKEGAQERLQTQITHDDSATWEPLPAPAGDSDGVAYQCGKACHLHVFFQGNSKGYSTIHSVPSATGLLMAVGSDCNMHTGCMVH